MSLFIKKYHIGKQDLNLNLTLNLPGLTTCQIKCMSLFIRKYNIGKGTYKYYVISFRAFSDPHPPL